jgi:uncharacterized protein YebE (UPF0316 family)
MPDAARPLVILALVLTEVGLWQWRVLLTGRGARGVPALLGIVGAVLQITAIAQVVAYVRDPLTVAAYALGVGGGTLTGVIVAARFTTDAAGVDVLADDPRLERRLRARGWPVTSYQGRSGHGTVHLLRIVVDGRRRAALLDDVTRLAPRASWTVETVRPGPAPPPLAGRGEAASRQPVFTGTDADRRDRKTETRTPARRHALGDLDDGTGAGQPPGRRLSVEAV